MDKVLLVTDVDPHEYYTGTQQRSNLILKSLSEKFAVDVLVFTSDENLDFKSHNENLWCYSIRLDSHKYSIFNRGYIFPKSIFCADKLKEHTSLSNYRYIVVRYISMVYLCGLEDAPNLVVDIDDLPSEKLLNRARNFKNRRKVTYYIKSLLAKKYTNDIIRNCYHAFLANPSQIISKKTTCLQNIPYPFFESNKITPIVFDEKENSILFIGLMNYYPNYEGVDWFLTNVWPRVLNLKSDVLFKIIGRNLPVELKEKWSEQKNVHYLGFVEDIFIEYEKSKLVVIPIYQGAGTNIKVLEAMLVKKACVVSEYAIRGFENLIINQVNAFIAKSIDDYVDNIISLLNNSELNDRMSNRASETIRENYSYLKFKQEFLDYLE